MCSPLFKFSHLYKIGNPKCQELIFIFFLSCEGAGVMCSLTICLSSPTNEKRDRKPELPEKELPPHPELLVPSRVHCSINGKRRVVMKRERDLSSICVLSCWWKVPAVFVNKPETAIHNGKRQRDPELLVPEGG